MLYLITGDNKKIYQKADGVVKSLLSKKTNASIFKINSENFDPERLAELIVESGIFVDKHIVTLNKLFEVAPARDFILENIEEIKESENVFILIEEKVDAKSFKKLEKFADKVQEFKESEKESTKFNIFSLTDVLAERNKKRLWVLYREALEAVSAEEIYGILWWQIKTLLIVKKSKDIAESGLKPFVFNKSKAALKNFPGSDLEILSERMIDLYHLSRRGEADLSIKLEEFVLEL